MNFSQMFINYFLKLFYENIYDLIKINKLMNMLLENTFVYDWFGSIFRLVALLILYVFVTISSVSTLDKYRKIKRETFEETGGAYKGLPVSIIVLNALLLGAIGVLIVYPIVGAPTIFAEEEYMMYELVSGTVLCVLFVWLIIDITYHKNLEKNKFSLLIISYGGFILLLIMELFFKGRMLIFITIFVLYINLELNGATMWILWDLDRQKNNERLVLITLLSFVFVPVLYVLCSMYTDPAVQAALAVSAIAHALVVVYYSGFFDSDTGHFKDSAYLMVAGWASFAAAIVISPFLPNPTSGGGISSLLVASTMYSFCLMFMINFTIRDELKFEKDRRSKTLLVTLVLTLGFWGLFILFAPFFMSAKGFTLQSDFLSLLTLSPTGWFSFMIAVAQTIAFVIFLSIAAWDLWWIQELIRWLRKHAKIFVYTSFVCFIALAGLLIISAIVPSIFSTFPPIYTLFAIFGIVGLVCFGASYYSESDALVYLIFCYIGLGFAYAIVFAPMSLGILGIIGLVILFGVLIGYLLSEIKYLKDKYDRIVSSIMLPIGVGILTMLLGLTLMNVRIINRITASGTATLAEMFEWFFALAFAANAVVTSFFLSEDNEKSMVYVFITGVVFASIAHLVKFTWDTRLSIALSYSWVASAVALMLPALFVLFKDFWDALRADKWSSVILSILAGLILMFASGTKFTPGLPDFANSVLSIILAVGLVVGYFIYIKKKKLIKPKVKPEIKPAAKPAVYKPVDDKPRKEDFTSEKE